MKNRGVFGGVGVWIALAGVVSCGGETTAGIGQVGQALVGVDEFLFLRCNATSWNADATNRLTDTDDDGLLTLEYDVREAYMLTGGDQCVVTRTNSASGWGSSSASFGTASPAVVTAPGQWTLGAVNSTPVTIRYPELGRYRATVDYAARTVNVTPVATQPQQGYYYLRCNATSWNVGASNRLTGEGTLSLDFDVNQSWMVSGGDQCIVTRTNQLDGWGTSQVAMGPTAATTLSVPADGMAETTIVPAGRYFSVRYPALGSYQATLDPSTGALSIGTPGPDEPDTGLHGDVEWIGDDRVRVTYDFEAAEQLLDFAPFNTATTALELVNGRLVVRNLGASGLIEADLVTGFKVDTMLYEAELLEGNHINVYVGLAPSGSWSPAQGYGMIHRGDGRLAVANQEAFMIGGAGVTAGTVYSGRIDTTETEFVWSVDGVASTAYFPYYGGTDRTIALGGYASTVAFDNLVLEGTVEGFESDGVEDDPDAIHGAVEDLPDGRVRISYDFSDEQQKFDFVPATVGETRRELNDGRLVVSGLDGAESLKMVLLDYDLHIDSVTYRAELLSGDHVNVYVNTIWDGNWTPAVGCGGIHRFDGRLVTFNGTATATTDTAPVERGLPYSGILELSAMGMSWTVNASSLLLEGACYGGTDGTLAIGGWQSDVAFDDLVIEGRLP